MGNRASAAEQDASRCGGDIAFGARVLRGGEDLRGVAVFDQMAEVEEGGLRADARGLLHGMGDDHDAIVLLQLVDEFLDARRGDGVEGRARFIHQDHVRVHGNGAGDAEALLLAAGKARTWLHQSILHLLEEPSLAQALHEVGRRLHAHVGLEQLRLERLVERLVDLRVGPEDARHLLEPRPGEGEPARAPASSLIPEAWGG